MWTLFCLLRLLKIVKEYLDEKSISKKRGKYYQYQFEIASQGGKRKWKTKSGFLNRASAYDAGCIAYNEYTQTGRNFVPTEISYSDYLDYWVDKYVEVNLKYNTIRTYKNIINTHIKPKLGVYQLSKITSASIQEFITDLFLTGRYTKKYLRSILKVVKSSFTYAADVVEFIKNNPSLKAKIPKYETKEKDPVHILTKD